jgi:zeta-carotene desaturase
MADVLIIGGGLAGLAAAAALGQSGRRVTLLEARAFSGGRATSYPVPGKDPDSGEVIDNCQHILLRCCVNLLDFYKRLGVERDITFHREFYFIEPGGRTSVMKAGALPKPLHFAGSFASLKFLDLADKAAVARGLLAIRRERRREDLDRITMLEWLKEKRQTPRAIERFWRQVLVSAVNEELDRMAASHGFQVMWLGFLVARDSYEMGIPNVPLGELYSSEAWSRIPNVELRFRTPVSRIALRGGRVAGVETAGGMLEAEHYISAVPFERLAAIAPEACAAAGLRLEAFEHSPITGIHLWFDRKVTDLPHGTLLDRTIQWFFNKSEGRYLQLVVSASRALEQTPRNGVINLALAELAEFLPVVKTATLVKAHVVKELRATFSARPGLEALRPPAGTAISNLSLAGDWTRSGWPATMEGAVRSGYLAAEDAAARLGRPERYLLPDIG